MLELLALALLCDPKRLLITCSVCPLSVGLSSVLPFLGGEVSICIPCSPKSPSSDVLRWNLKALIVQEGCQQGRRTEGRSGDKVARAT